MVIYIVQGDRFGNFGHKILSLAVDERHEGSISVESVTPELCNSIEDRIKRQLDDTWLVSIRLICIGVEYVLSRLEIPNKKSLIRALLIETRFHPLEKFV